MAKLSPAWPSLIVAELLSLMGNILPKNLQFLLGRVWPGQVAG